MSSAASETRRWTIWRTRDDFRTGQWAVGEPPCDVLVERVEVVPASELENARTVARTLADDVRAWTRKANENFDRARDLGVELERVSRERDEWKAAAEAHERQHNTAADAAARAADERDEAREEADVVQGNFELALSVLKGARTATRPPPVNDDAARAAWERWKATADALLAELGRGGQVMLYGEADLREHGNGFVRQLREDRRMGRGDG